MYGRAAAAGGNGPISALGERRESSGAAACEPLERRRMMSVSGPSTIAPGATYTMNLTPDLSSGVSGWSVDWNDGSTVQSLAGTASSATHTYGTVGTYRPTATATYASGSPATTVDALGVDVSS